MPGNSRLGGGGRGGNIRKFWLREGKYPEIFLARAFGARGFLFHIVLGGARKTRVRVCVILGDFEKSTRCGRNGAIFDFYDDPGGVGGVASGCSQLPHFFRWCLTVRMISSMRVF